MFAVSAASVDEVIVAEISTTLDSLCSATATLSLTSCRGQPVAESVRGPRRYVAELHKFEVALLLGQ